MITGNCAPADNSLPRDTRRTPERVSAVHLPDQIANFATY